MRTQSFWCLTTVGSTFNTAKFERLLAVKILAAVGENQAMSASKGVVPDHNAPFLFWHICRVPRITKSEYSSRTQQPDQVLARTYVLAPPVFATQFARSKELVSWSRDAFRSAGLSFWEFAISIVIVIKRLSEYSENRRRHTLNFKFSSFLRNSLVSSVRSVFLDVVFRYTAWTLLVFVSSFFSYETMH